MAPNRFMAITPEIRLVVDSNVEKTTPENTNGMLSTTTASRRPRAVEGNPPDCAATQPTANEAKRPRYGMR